MMTKTQPLLRERVEEKLRGAGAAQAPVLAQVPMRCQSSGYIDTCMWLAATYNEPNIRTAPTAKLIATAMAKV